MPDPNADPPSGKETGNLSRLRGASAEAESGVDEDFPLISVCGNDDPFLRRDPAAPVMFRSLVGFHGGVLKDGMVKVRLVTEMVKHTFFTLAGVSS